MDLDAARHRVAGPAVAGPAGIYAGRLPRDLEPAIRLPAPAADHVLRPRSANPPPDVPPSGGGCSTSAEAQLKVSRTHRLDRVQTAGAVPSSVDEFTIRLEFFHVYRHHRCHRPLRPLYG